MYIFWFLHQTTTMIRINCRCFRCISFDSYIKPQPDKEIIKIIISCISFDSYIKPQLLSHYYCICWVVYLLIPTSNHNCGRTTIVSVELYIFWFLHQTTTGHVTSIIWALLYIFWFLHQTTTMACRTIIRILLYIFWFLHQTTTSMQDRLDSVSCISFDSYIKPQLLLCVKLLHFSCISFDSYIKPQLPRSRPNSFCVVYLLIPTSNHNTYHSFFF